MGQYIESVVMLPFRANYFNKLIFVISLSGPISSSGCASADLAEGLFQTRQPTQYCEWRNGVYADDAVCYCGTNECNAKEMLENWIENGGGCKLFLNLLEYLETRKSLKDQNSCDK